MNMIYLVGRITSDLETKEVNNKKYATMTIATERSFKNEDGIYETDFFNISLWLGIAESAAEYCRKGDLVGIKGRLQSNEIEKEDGSKEYKTEIIAEKLSFLASSKN